MITKNKPKIPKRPLKKVISKLTKLKPAKKNVIKKNIQSFLTPIKTDNSMKKTITEEKTETNAAGNIVRKITTITEEYVDHGTGVGKPVSPRTKTQVLFVLDKSSSMQLGRTQTIAAFNDQIDAIRKNDGNTDVEVSLITFSDMTYADIVNRELGSVPALSLFSYNPYGNTALYDGIALAINTAKLKMYSQSPDNAVLVAIFTDGEENASKHHNFASIKSMINQEMAKGNWTFTVAGPRRSLHLMSELGIPKGNIIGFEPTSELSREWVGHVGGAATASYMSARSVGATQTFNSMAVGMASVGADPSLSKNADADNSWPLPPTTAKGVGIAIDNASVKIENIAAAWPFPTNKVNNTADTDK